MKERLTSIFARLASEQRAGLIPFITGGYPSLDTTAPAIEAIAGAGAAAIEIGIPFSDPIADGPVIAASMHTALEAGVTVRAVLERIARARSRTEIGVVVMVSSSIVTRLGECEFLSSARDSGVDGIVVPDMDLARGQSLADACQERGMSIAFLIAPTTPSERAARICGCCRGFVYLLARTGLTGEQGATPVVKESCARLRSVTKLPIAAGFGISTPDHVAEVTKHADAAIVGSALVRRMGHCSPVDAAAEFTSDLARALRSGAPPA